MPPIPWRLFPPKIRRHEEVEEAAEAALTEIVVALVEEAQRPWEEVGQMPSPEEAAGEAVPDIVVFVAVVEAVFVASLCCGLH